MTIKLENLHHHQLQEVTLTILTVTSQITDYVLIVLWLLGQVPLAQKSPLTHHQVHGRYLTARLQNVKTYKSENRFLPVIPQPPSDSVCKYYLNFLLDLKSDLEINHIFRHSDQDAFYKISQIIWKDKKYDSVINIMRGFHILLIKLKILYKK